MCLALFSSSTCRPPGIFLFVLRVVSWALRLLWSLETVGIGWKRREKGVFVSGLMLLWVCFVGGQDLW